MRQSPKTFSSRLASSRKSNLSESASLYSFKLLSWALVIKIKWSVYYTICPNDICHSVKFAFCTIWGYFHSRTTFCVSELFVLLTLFCPQHRPSNTKYWHVDDEGCSPLDWQGDLGGSKGMRCPLIFGFFLLGELFQFPDANPARDERSAIVNNFPAVFCKRKPMKIFFHSFFRLSYIHNNKFPHGKRVSCTNWDTHQWDLKWRKKTQNPITIP